DGDDFGTRGNNCLARLREIPIFAGADEQTRSICAASDEQRIGMARFGRSMRGIHKEPPAAAADGADDLDAVAAREARRGVAALRHDLAVLFDGDAFTLDLELANEGGEGGRRCAQRARSAVDGDGKHGTVMPRAKSKV